MKTPGVPTKTFSANGWDNLLLSELLDGLREKADTPKVKDSLEYEGDKKALRRAGMLRASLGKFHGSNKSAAKGFLQSAAQRIGNLIAGGSLIGPDGRAVMVSGVNTVLDASGRVEGSLLQSENQLRLLLPDTVVTDEARWPGPISYRSALNHFVAVCIRVHSIAPEAAFEEVLYHSAKRVLVPALAHNMKFFAKEYPGVYRAFVHDESIKLRMGFKLTEISQAAEGMPGSERYFYRKWARLFNVMMDSASFISPDRRGDLFMLYQKLLKDYEAEPRTSQLWQELSVIASSDLAVDEVVVSRVLDDVGMGSQDLGCSPLVNCARQRFGLLRYAYGMQHEALEFKARFGYGEAEVESLMRRLAKLPKGGRLDPELAKNVFGWAYILSRYLLLGRQSIDVSDAGARRRQDASKLLCDLLDAAIQSDTGKRSPEGLLALRYQIGFLTNPRFEKMSGRIRNKEHPDVYSSAVVEDYIRSAEKEESNGMPKTIVDMARARVVLHHAMAQKPGTAGRSRDLQSALNHYAKILKELASPGDASIMDGEVIAWVLPEIHYTLGELSKCNPGDEAHWESVQKAILVLGEVQYGVYYNPQEEMKRIENGLLMAVGKQAMN